MIGEKSLSPKFLVDTIFIMYQLKLIMLAIIKYNIVLLLTLIIRVWEIWTLDFFIRNTKKCQLTYKTIHP